MLAAEAGQPIDAFGERVLQGLVHADIEIRDGIPVMIEEEARQLSEEEAEQLKDASGRC